MWITITTGLGLLSIGIAYYQRPKHQDIQQAQNNLTIQTKTESASTLAAEHETTKNSDLQNVDTETIQEKPAISHEDTTKQTSASQVQTDAEKQSHHSNHH
jgi:hypothetical protein